MLVQLGGPPLTPDFQVLISLRISKRSHGPPTNTCQYHLIKQLTGVSGMLTAVGDDDQSIYAWRGAQPENLNLLKVDFPNLHVVMLEQNYRSTSRILRNANTLIANNDHIFEKKLWSEHGDGDMIRAVRLENEEAEAERVVNEIMLYKLKKQCKYSDFAILYRGNHQARIIEIKLKAQQIPYRMSGGQSFFSKAEVKDIMGYLRLIVNPDDDNAFLRVINTPRRQIGPSTLTVLGEYANERQQSLYESIGDLALKQKFNNTMYMRLERFHTWMENIRRHCEDQGEASDPVTIIREMVSDINYFGWLVQNSSSVSVAEKRMANVEFLIESIRNTKERNEENDEDPSLQSVITRMLLLDLLEQQNEDDEEDQVQMLTLHAAKGLEFPIVFLIGMEEELLPHKNSIEQDTIEEERRLAYVGITRAKKTLIMTLSSERRKFGETHATTPSRVLSELSDDDIEWEGMGDKVTPEQQEQRAEDALSALKNLFD
ncbi:MAG: 3'-5' exonuclease [Pseudomonadota bacterium]